MEYMNIRNSREIIAFATEKFISPLSVGFLLQSRTQLYSPIRITQEYLGQETRVRDAPVRVYTLLDIM